MGLAQLLLSQLFGEDLKFPKELIGLTLTGNPFHITAAEYKNFPTQLLNMHGTKSVDRDNYGLRYREKKNYIDIWVPHN